MTKEEILHIAEHNVMKAKKSYDNNYNRNGITMQEKNNLANNLEYSKIVYDLINKFYKE